MTAHARARAMERYGVSMTALDENVLLMKIASGDARLVRQFKGEQYLEIWAVNWTLVGEEIGVVTPRTRDCVITIMPRDAAELDSGRASLGDVLGQVWGARA